ncbi:MAG: hypothetical protein FJW63_08340 [Actinobacteria bacterium]|nr:hypothetical protein [Actinomycetota bacterium]
MIIEQKKGQADASVELVKALAIGDTYSVQKLFTGEIDIDDPFAGRNTGDSANNMIKDWRSVKGAIVKSIKLEHFTIANECSAAEITLSISQSSKHINLPIVVVADINGKKWDRVRIYYRRAWIDGKQHVRPRMLDKRKLGKMPPIVEEYHRCLREGDVEGMLKVFTPEGCYLDGHGQSTNLSLGIGMGYFEGKEGIRDVFNQLATFEHGDGNDYLKGASVGEYLEHLNIFSDERTTVLEFNIVRPNDPENSIQAGVACYELADDGLLLGARIYDEGY